MSNFEAKYTLNERDVPPAKVRLEDGWKEMNIKWLVSEQNMGCKSAVLFKAVIKAGSAHEKHRHNYADELTYIVSGKGRRGMGEENEEWDIGPGDVCFYPRGMVHWTYGTDPEDPIIGIGVYVGAGSLEGTGYEFVERLEPKALKP